MDIESLAEAVLAEYTEHESTTRGDQHPENLTFHQLQHRLSHLGVAPRDLRAARRHLWMTFRLRLQYDVKPDRPNIMNGRKYHFRLE
jgi:hypothetical protein